MVDFPAFAPSRLEHLRDALRARGQRPSILMPSAQLAEAMDLVEQWGSFVELMYLVMASDRRVKNVEREVLRGALAVLSNEAVRTRHMEAMLDAAARSVAAEGTEARLTKVLTNLAQDSARAESAAVVAAAVAAADDRYVFEESEMMKRIVRDLGIDQTRATEILADLERVTDDESKTMPAIT